MPSSSVVTSDGSEAIQRTIERKEFSVENPFSFFEITATVEWIHKGGYRQVNLHSSHFRWLFNSQMNGLFIHIMCLQN